MQWEYRAMSYHKDRAGLEAALDFKGAAGWELVSTTLKDDGWLLFVFKRRK